MRLRTLALALTLCFGSTALIEASPAKAKPYKLKKAKTPKKAKPAPGAHGVVANSSKVKPHKAKKSNVVHKS